MLVNKVTSVVLILFAVFSNVASQGVRLVIVPSSSAPAPPPTPSPVTLSIFDRFITSPPPPPVPTPTPTPTSTPTPTPTSTPTPTPAPSVTRLIDPDNLRIVLVAAIEAQSCDRTSNAIAEDSATEALILRAQGEEALTTAIDYLVNQIVEVFLEQGAEVEISSRFVPDLVGLILQARDGGVIEVLEESLQQIIVGGCGLLFGDVVSVLPPSPEPEGESVPKEEISNPEVVPPSGGNVGTTPSLGYQTYGFDPTIGN